MNNAAELLDRAVSSVDSGELLCAVCALLDALPLQLEKPSPLQRLTYFAMLAYLVGFVNATPE